MESIHEVPNRLRPITGITRSSSNSASPIFQDLSDDTISVDERNFLCRELRGHHNLLGLPTQFALSVENRYGIKRQTVNHWLRNFDSGKPQFLFRGGAFAVSPEERSGIRATLSEGRSLNTPMSQHDFVDEVNAAAQRDRARRRLPPSDSSLCKRTIDRMQEEEHVRVSTTDT